MPAEWVSSLTSRGTGATARPRSAAAESDRVGSMPPALMPVEEYAATVRELLGVAEPAQVPIGDADGLVLAADLLARVALPTFDNSAMDGYAVRHQSLRADGPTTLPVCADIPAGRTDVPALAAGSAARIMTGAPLPEGADTVVPVELTDAAQTGAAPAQVTIAAAVDPGRHVRVRARRPRPVTC